MWAFVSFRVCKRATLFSWKFPFPKAIFLKAFLRWDQKFAISPTVTDRLSCSVKRTLSVWGHCCCFLSHYWLLAKAKSTCHTPFAIRHLPLWRPQHSTSDLTAMSSRTGGAWVTTVRNRITLGCTGLDWTSRLPACCWAACWLGCMPPSLLKCWTLLVRLLW